MDRERSLKSPVKPNPIAKPVDAAERLPRHQHADAVLFHSSIRKSHRAARKHLKPIFLNLCFQKHMKRISSNKDIHIYIISDLDIDILDLSFFARFIEIFVWDVWVLVPHD